MSAARGRTAAPHVGEPTPPQAAPGLLPCSCTRFQPSMRRDEQVLATLEGRPLPQVCLCILAMGCRDEWRGGIWGICGATCNHSNASSAVMAKSCRVVPLYQPGWLHGRRPTCPRGHRKSTPMSIVGARASLHCAEKTPTQAPGTTPLLTRPITPDRPWHPTLAQPCQGWCCSGMPPRQGPPAPCSAGPSLPSRHKAAHGHLLPSMSAPPHMLVSRVYALRPAHCCLLTLLQEHE